MEEENPFTKSQTIDPFTRAQIYSLVNALGGTGSDEAGRYVLGDEGLDVLQDLKRWIRVDNLKNKLDVARCIAEANAVRGDLLPLLSTWKENGRADKAKTTLVLSCLELLTYLTWPLEQEEMTANLHRHTPYIAQAQVKYKAAILHWESTSVLRQAIRAALPALTMTRDTRTSRDDSVIKIVLLFIRNVAAIQQMPNLPSQGLDAEVSRSATIETFRAQDVFALLLTICSNMGEDFNLLDVTVLEIIFNLVKGVDVEKVWMTQHQRTRTDIEDLRQVLASEEALHTEARKKGWSRHGRFGTMIWVKDTEKNLKAVSGQDNLKSYETAMFNVDQNKKWNKPIQKRKDLDFNMNDFDRKEPLSDIATEQLRSFAEEFLDSGFNPLIAHLRKAIEREAERLQPINYRQVFYVVAWFLKAERTRRERQHQEKPQSKASTDLEPESYGLVAAVLNQETFILLNRYMQRSWDDKEWQDLNASMRCFTEVLLTVQNMAQSPLDEDQEIAENIQNRIFYEETTHDRVRLLLQGYKDQGIGYLDACTELSHVFMKMLERYSKENVDLQIRSKRKARRKQRAVQQQNDSNDGLDNADEASEDEDVVDAIQVTKERKFDFKRFVAKFVSQSSVDTFISLLRFYKDLTPQQLKRVHRFLYRVAFKQDRAVLLYRVDVMALLYKLIEGPEGLASTHGMFKEWQEFCKQLFRKLFKKLDERPELMVEMLFSKISNTLHYLEYGHDLQPSYSRPPADLEVKDATSRSRDEQIGIVVTILLRDHKSTLVDWIRRLVSRAFDERSGWEAEAEARREAARDAQVSNSEGSSQTPAALELPDARPSYLTIVPENDECKIAMFKNGKLKLLMKLVGMVEEVNDRSNTPDATWILPSHVVAADLAESKAAIEKFTVEHWVPDDEDDNPEDFLRRARKADRSLHDGNGVDENGEARRDGFIDDSEGEEILPEEEEFLFPDNPRQKSSAMQKLRAKRASKKRKRGTDEEDDGTDSEDEALRAERRRRRQEAALERRRKFKSDAYIRDSDDESDEEKDKEFFAKEAELRRKYEQKNQAQMLGASTDADEDETSQRKRRKTLARLRGDGAEEDESDHEVAAEGEEGMHPDSTPPSAEDRQQAGHSDVETDPESTPPSSPPSDASIKVGQRQALRPMRQGSTSKSRNSIEKARAQPGNSSQSDLVVADPPEIMTKAAGTASHRRAGFVIEDDEEEE